MGRKKPWAAKGTCVLLAAVVGRLRGARLPATLLALGAPTPRRGGPIWDHLGWLPELAVAMDEGRDGGRPGSPVGPVMPMMRAPVELFASGVVMAAV